MPRHVSPTDRQRTATAPYNFVPLPERVFTVEEGIEVSGQKIKPWEAHDRFVPGTQGGWIDLTITTLTPLYVRGPVARRGDGNWDPRDSRPRPEPYATPDGRPAIPGSSLRGMLRTLVEILAFAKIQPVSDAKPFFRSVSDDRIGKAYRARMARGAGRRSGFLRRRGHDCVIVPCEVLRVEKKALPDRTHDGNTPRWELQQRECWVQKRDECVTKIELSDPRDGTWSHGTLVLTGTVPKKKREFVFLDPDSTSPAVLVPQAIWDRFHDEDQITRWQEKAFPKDRPRNGRRHTSGHLRDGEPVFLLTDERAKREDNPDGLVFLGRAGMFRFPYDLGPSDLIPTHLTRAGLDLAEAMFGRVPDDKATGGPAAIKGRVFFEDAVASDGGPEWLDDVIVPRILSAPKVTTFQHYLTQDGGKGRDQLTTYLEGDETTIRGHKLYWHRWDEARGIDLVKEPKNHDAIRDALLAGNEAEDTQHTVIRPVKAGVTFAGRIRFDNLTDLELGALLEALQLPEGCHHRLGMGKPLGLGSIRIDARLRLIDRAARYRSWQASGIREDETGTRFREVFRTAMLDHARASGETLITGNDGLRRIARLDAFYRMLEWTSRPSPNSTAYMERPQDFKERPVLPTPHAVAGIGEPSWPPDPPRPGASDDGSTHRQQSTLAGGRVQTTARSTLDRPSRPSVPARPASQPPPVRPTTPKTKPVERGQTRPGILRRRGNDWVAVFEGDPREALILNGETILHDCQDGASAEFYITEQSKKAGIKCRMQPRRTEPRGA